MADSASGLIHCLSRGKAGKLQLVFRKLQQSVWLTIVSLEGKGRPVLHAHELLRLHVPLTFVSRLLFADGITTAGLMMWKWLACWQQKANLFLSLSLSLSHCDRLSPICDLSSSPFAGGPATPFGLSIHAVKAAGKSVSSEM